MIRRPFPFGGYIPVKGIDAGKDWVLLFTLGFLIVGATALWYDIENWRKKSVRLTLAAYDLARGR
jgi:hypothetical protein